LKRYGSGTVAQSQAVHYRFLTWIAFIFRSVYAVLCLTSLNVEPQIERFGRTELPPVVSVIVLNYNGEKWLAKCFESIRSQTIAGQVETIFADNNSSDSSMATARQWLAGFPTAMAVQTGANLGFCAGNNVASQYARGQYLLFLNADAWLEPDCLEKLLAETRRTAAAAASPWVLNYSDNSHQDLGFFGFDLFGLPSGSHPVENTREIFIACGCAYFIEAKVFKQVGMFDAEFFMYADEVDLSWRVWLAGHRIVGIPSARVHHRGAINANPAGGARTVEFRTNDQKRFFTNRNCLLTLLKDGQHLIVLGVLPQVLLLALETAVGCVLLRRLSFAKNTFWNVLKDCWRLRHHVRAEHKRIAAFRRHGDFWMLCFFRLKPNRWYEIQRLFRFGKPRVDDR
jgi:GT2 family glycosyltransferase